MQYLANHLGNDRGITLSEIGKIALYMGDDKEVTLDTAMELIGHNAAEGLEEICHAVACGDAEQQTICFPACCMKARSLSPLFAHCCAIFSDWKSPQSTSLLDRHRKRP